MQTAAQIDQIMKTFLQAKAQLDAQQKPQQVSTPEMQRFQGRLESYVRSMHDYENPDWQAAARLVIPIERLTEAAKKLVEEPAPDTKPLSFRDELLKQLLAWFKFEFFKWTNEPECHFCTSKTKFIGQAPPTSSEAPFRPGYVELYRCDLCEEITRFPRYNHAKKLLETKNGRCGEWAQCFTLCARSLGYEVRSANDWTDHVWTEVYSEAQGRWLHCDSCENTLDAPLLYEAGWGKKLNYVVACSIEEVVDVTERYTHKYEEVLTRRTLVPEQWLSSVICKMSEEKFNKLESKRKDAIKERRVVEEKEFKRNRNGGEEKTELKEEEQQGRITGSLEWRAARGELGDTSKSAQDEKKPE